MKIPTPDLRVSIPTVPAETGDSGAQGMTQSRPSSPLNKGAFERLDSFRPTPGKAEHSPTGRNFQNTLAGGPDSALKASVKKSVDDAKSFDDFTKLLGTGGIVRLKPGDQKELFEKATFGLVMKLGKELGTTALAERTDILKNSVTGIARVPLENFRSIGMTTAASKLNLIQAKEHQAVFDHIHDTIAPLSPETRWKGLESLGAQIFRSNVDERTQGIGGQIDQSAESIDLGRGNMKKVLAGVDGLKEPEKKLTVLCNLANVSQLFSLHEGNWQSPIGDLVNAMKGLPKNLQPALRQRIDNALAQVESTVGKLAVDAQRDAWGLGKAAA